MAANEPSKLIPRTPIVGRYLDVKTVSQEARLKLAEADTTDPDGLAQLLMESVRLFATYENDEAFHPASRPDPVGGLSLWKTDDVASRLHGSGVLEVKASGDSPIQLVTLTYVARELQPARTTGELSHRVQKVMAKANEELLPLVTLDLLLRAGDGLPVVCEVKTPSDVDAYVALIQVLAAASQLATPAQARRLRTQYSGAGFADAADPRVDAVIITVDPERCGAPQSSLDSIKTKGTPKYRASLARAAREVASALSGVAGVGDFVRRIALIEVGLEGAGLVADARWAFSMRRSGAQPYVMPVRDLGFFPGVDVDRVGDELTSDDERFEDR